MSLPDGQKVETLEPVSESMAHSPHSSEAKHACWDTWHYHDMILFVFVLHALCDTDNYELVSRVKKGVWELL